MDHKLKELHTLREALKQLLNAPDLCSDGQKYYAEATSDAIENANAILEETDYVENIFK